MPYMAGVTGTFKASGFCDIHFPVRAWLSSGIEKDETLSHDLL